MPKFSESEKKIIQERLLSQGERLFTAYGVKKVTVDEIVKATGIAKGSFYAYYSNKEHLYMDIAGRLQEKMWCEMEDFLEKHRELSPRQLCKACFLWMFDSLERYPMLMQADGETAEYLYRKLPPEVMEAHTRDDSRELERLQEYGIHFTCGQQLATMTLQTLAISFLNLQKDSSKEQHQVMEIILDGVLGEIVGEKHD